MISRYSIDDVYDSEPPNGAACVVRATRSQHPSACGTRRPLEALPWTKDDTIVPPVIDIAEIAQRIHPNEWLGRNLRFVVYVKPTGFHRTCETDRQRALFFRSPEISVHFPEICFVAHPSLPILTTALLLLQAFTFLLSEHCYVPHDHWAKDTFFTLLIRVAA